MDDLVYICTKIARQMDANGLDRVFEAAQAATLAIEDGRPLLARAIELADEVKGHRQSLSVRIVGCCSFSLAGELWQRKLESGSRVSLSPAISCAGAI